MENFSFTITEGREISYSVNVGTNVSATTLTMQIRKNETLAWSTFNGITLTASGTNVGIFIPATEANTTLAPSLYRILSNSTSIIEGKIFLYTGRSGAGDVFVKNVQTVMGNSLVAGDNITIGRDEATGKVTINSTGGGGGSSDPEVIRDTVANALVAGTNITINHNDAANTITISSTGGAGGTSDHGSLIGLGDDDHPQYLTQARADARYYTEAETDSLLNAKASNTPATTTANGLMVSADKSKLNSIASGATVYTDAMAASAVGGMLWVGTQAEYDQIPVKATTPKTFYFITDKPSGTIYTNDFDRPNGALPFGWSGTPGTTGGLTEILNNQLHIVSGTTTGSIVRWTRNTGTSAGWDVTFQYTLGNSVSALLLFASSDSARATDYYQLQITTTTSRLGKRVNGGTFTTIGTNLTRTSTAGTKHWCNYRVNSLGDINVYYWADGSAKPSVPQQSVLADPSRADIAPGFLYFGVANSATTPHEVFIDNVAVEMV